MFNNLVLNLIWLIKSSHGSSIIATLHYFTSANTRNSNYANNTTYSFIIQTHQYPALPISTLPFLFPTIVIEHLKPPDLNSTYINSLFKHVFVHYTTIINLSFRSHYRNLHVSIPQVMYSLFNTHNFLSRLHFINYVFDLIYDVESTISCIKIQL